MKLSRRSLIASALVLPARIAGATQAPGGLSVGTSWPNALLMATGRPGGAYDVYGPAWGRLAARSSGVAIAYRASGGAVSDILFIEEGSAQLGMTTVTVADQARSGAGAWTAGVRFGDFRALFPMFPSILQIVAPARSGITTLAGLTGRGIGIGPDGGSAAATVRAILTSVGVTPGRLATGDFIPQMQDMLAGGLEACAFISAPPSQAIYAAAQHTGLRLIGFTQDEAEQVTHTVPGMSGMTIQAATFPGQSVAIASIGTPNFAIGAKALPDALVNAITLAAMRNRASLAALVPAAAQAPAPLLAMPGQMTFHPGAALALRSLGLDVPAAQVED